MLDYSGLGLNSSSRNVLRDNTSTSQFQSLYNNGVSRLQFKVNSFLPTRNATTDFNAREFSNFAYVPVLQHLGNNGLIGLPAAFNWVNSDNIPTRSQMTNWGGNQQPTEWLQSLPLDQSSQQQPIAWPQNVAGLGQPLQQPIMAPQWLQMASLMAPTPVFIAPPIYLN